MENAGEWIYKEEAKNWRKNVTKNMEEKKVVREI